VVKERETEVLRTGGGYGREKLAEKYYTIRGRLYKYILYDT
jgi:hypothetical protein